MNLWVGTCSSMGVCLATRWTYKSHPEGLLGEAPPTPAKIFLDCQCFPTGKSVRLNCEFIPASTPRCCVNEWLMERDMQGPVRAELLYLTEDRVNLFLLESFWNTIRSVILTTVNAWPTQLKGLFQEVCGSLPSSSCDQPGGCVRPFVICWFSPLSMSLSLIRQIDRYTIVFLRIVHWTIKVMTDLEGYPFY